MTTKKRDMILGYTGAMLFCISVWVGAYWIVFHVLSAWVK